MAKNRLSAVVRATAVVALAVVLQGSDCLRDLNKSVNNVLASFDNAISTLARESSSWQGTLKGLEEDLVAAGRSDLANEVQNLLDRGIAKAGVELRCEQDFIGSRMREGLQNIRARLAGEPQQPLKPWFCTVSPTSIDLRLAPERRNTIDVYGYNFDLASVQALLFDQDGSSVNLGPWTNSPSHYIMTVNAVNAPFRATSLRVVFRLPDGEERSVGIIQPPPCGALGQACCNGSCNDANATCVDGTTCRVQVSDVLIRGSICGLGHSQLLPNPNCNGQTIREGAPNGNCPAGWQFIQMCDMGASGGTQFFACMLTSDTRVTAIPQGLLCGYGHTQNYPNATCGGQPSRYGCPSGFQFAHLGDLGASAGTGFFGCIAASAIPLTEAAPRVPQGTVCGLSHSCNNFAQAHQCGAQLVRPPSPGNCPSGYSFAMYGDLGASSGQGQYACAKQ